MGIGRRLLESKLSWLTRVMKMHDVDFGLATDIDDNKWVMFMEDGNDRVCFHRISGGPEIGRMHLTTNQEVDHYTYQFCTRNKNTHIRGLVYKADTDILRQRLASKSYVFTLLKPETGVHLYTGPDGTKWYGCSDISWDETIRLVTKEELGINQKRGWFSMSVLDQYEGKWFVDNLDTTREQVILSLKHATLANIVAPKTMKERVTLEHKTTTGNSAVTVLWSAGEGRSAKKEYNLTINLIDVIEEYQVLDIHWLLKQMVKDLFDGRQARINLDQIDFIIDHKLVKGKELRKHYGNTYYCSNSNNPSNDGYLEIVTYTQFPHTY